MVKTNLQHNDCNFKTKLYIAYREMRTQNWQYLDDYGSFQAFWAEKWSWCWIQVGIVLILHQAATGLYA